MNSNVNINNGNSTEQTTVVAEVGWQFVTQYYNYVNAKPENLHYFYNKDSTFIHGFEDGDERTCFGQSEINSRVSEIGFENCKVFVHSLDSQSSADGGILVQVVGEMSNRNGPWRKFAQTFFLAQQQSGYFVLNDIFRYLRDDDEVDEEKQHTPVADVESDLKETTEDEATNGIAAPKVASPVPAAIASPTPPADVQAGEAEKVSSPVPAAATTSAVQSPKPATASPEKSNQPKTWANLAASNSKKWGQVAQDKVSPAIQSAATATSPRINKVDASKPLSQAQQNVQSVSHALCFVKNVTDQVQGNELRSILQAKFGLIRDVDVVRTKACAFVQFDKIESAKKAIIASHSKDQGGEGGIKIGNQTVMLESRREKPKNNKQNQQKKSRQSNSQSQSNRNKK